jgi:hypothetical protein
MELNGLNKLKYGLFSWVAGLAAHSNGRMYPTRVPPGGEPAASCRRHAFISLEHTSR